MRKRGIIAVLLVGVVALGVTGGVVLAQEDGAGDDSSKRSFAARVAEKLGLDESQVQEAFDEVRRDMADEAIDRKLARMVEAGRLTQEEADEIKAWSDSRPDSLSRGFPFGKLGKFKRFGRGPFCDKVDLSAGGAGGPTIISCAKSSFSFRVSP